MDYSVLFGGGASGAVVFLIAKVLELYWARCKTKSESILQQEKQRADSRLQLEKQQAEISIPVNEQAVAILKDIVHDLRADMARLVESMHKQDELMTISREDRIVLKAANEAMKVSNEALKIEIETLRKRVAELEAKK